MNIQTLSKHIPPINLLNWMSFLKRKKELIDNITSNNLKIAINWYLWKLARYFWINNPWMLLNAIKTWSLNNIIESIFKWPYFNKWDVSLYNSFIEYINNEEKVSQLLEWLDQESIDTVQKIILFINIIFSKEKIKIDDVFSETEIIKQKNIGQRIIEYIKRNWVRLPIPIFIYNQDNVFIERHWIDEIPDIKNKIEWKDIIDCWWFIWDSSIMFAKETKANRIYCFEPNPESIKLTKQSITINKLQWRIISVNKWVSSKSWNWEIDVNWWCSNIWKNWNKVELTSIDDFVDESRINPWLIKMDIEWEEYNAILWSLETLRKFKPILIISIYHNWRDFFEIKTLLENIWIGYKFKIRKTTCLHPICETVLIAY